MIFPYDYIPDPTKGRPLFYGKIYIGLPDTDPTLPGNEKDSFLIQENGSSVPAEYPILTSAGGVPTYNDSSVAISVTGSYSISILDNQNNQVYYFANAGGDESEFLASDLRSIMFNLGFLYDDIGTKLVTATDGVSLDGALNILDADTGAVWRLPGSIPPGTTVVSISGSTLTTNVGQFELISTLQNATNRWIDDQNFNVLGKDGYPLLDGTPQTILAGDEIAAGIIALTDCEQMTNVGGIINSDNNTGIIRRSYPKDPIGAITKESQYGGFKNHLGAQIQADVDAFSAGGAKISDDATHVYVDVNLATATDGLQFLFLANEPGIIENVSNKESLKGSIVALKVNGGVAVVANTRYEMDIAATLGPDYSSDDIEVKAEILNDGTTGVAGWGETGMYSTSTTSRFVLASTLNDKIIVQTGINGLSTDSEFSGSPFNLTAAIASAECRVIVRFK